MQMMSPELNSLFQTVEVTGQVKQVQTNMGAKKSQLHLVVCQHLHPFCRYNFCLINALSFQLAAIDYSLYSSVNDNASGS